MADLKKIRAFAFDIDGVMTDGGLLCDLNGELYRTFDAKDGFAVRMARMAPDTTSLSSPSSYSTTSGLIFPPQEHSGTGSLLSRMYSGG